jgi:hypothetical protein
VAGGEVPDDDVQVVRLGRRGEQGLLQLVGERPGRGRLAGQPVELGGLRLGGAPLAEVAEGDDDAGDLAVLDRGDGDQLDGHRDAVLAPEHLVVGEHGAAGADGEVDRALLARVRGAVEAGVVQQGVLVESALLGRRVAGEADGRGVDELDPSLDVEAVDAVGDVGQHPLVAGDRACELLLGRSHVHLRRPGQCRTCPGDRTSRSPGV